MASGTQNLRFRVWADTDLGFGNFRMAPLFSIYTVTVHRVSTMKLHVLPICK
jgi:hypothetical protein